MSWSRGADVATRARGGVQSIPWVADQFDKVEAMGFSDTIQKYLIAASWVALWGLVLGSMVAYVRAAPPPLAVVAVLVLAVVAASLRRATALTAAGGSLSVRALACDGRRR